jgi:hypothetical protein
MRLSAFDTFRMFLAIRNHFTQKSYDYFKYKGKTNVSLEAFSKRKDRYYFQKLCRKYEDSEMEDFLVANFIHGKSWVGEFLEEEANDIYLAYLKRKQGFTYHFRNEVSSLFSVVDSAPKVFEIKSGQYPVILNRLLSNELCMETFTILNQFIKFSDKFDAALGKDDVMWSKIRQLSTKLEPFLDYDKNTAKNILKEAIK